MDVAKIADAHSPVRPAVLLDCPGFLVEGSGARGCPPEGGTPVELAMAVAINV